MADPLSIEEANKFRLSVGMELLPVPGSGPQFKESKDAEGSSEEEQGSTLEIRQAKSYDNWKQLEKEKEARLQREARNEAIKKARDAAQRKTKLEGKGLGEEDEKGDLDTKTWLIQQKKRQRKIEKERLTKMEEVLKEQEQERIAGNYTAEDLAGVKVGHELGDLETGEDQVLTLKDATIDENEEEGDELENVDLKERERLEERLNVKRKRPVYDPHEADEAGQPRVLKHYDEAIEGKKRKRFTLDGQGSTAEQREISRQAVSEKMQSQLISLDTINDMAMSDYKDAEELKVRKPKKKAAKSSRKKAVDEEDVSPVEPLNGSHTTIEAMDINGPASNGTAPPGPKPKNESTSFVDDHDLQASLAVQRKAAIKEQNRVRLANFAQKVNEKEQKKTDEDNQVDGGGLTIDETLVFVDSLKQRSSQGEPQTQPRKPSFKARSDSPPVKSESEDIEMSQSYANISSSTPPPPADNLPDTGLDEEMTLTHGIGSTVTLLSQRGLIHRPSTDDPDINALYRARQSFLTSKHARESLADSRARAQRERDRASGKLDRLSAREREEYARWENRTRDQQESRLMAEIFNNEYKPNVELNYIDEFGRHMDKKEAFKHLSHQFHGKGSGKMKTEKRLKRIEEEKKREAKEILDSSAKTGMDNAMGGMAKRKGEAGVRMA
ncbi:MAG: hypothetical protein LQ342_004588 [Letrouitia transgressa]|nr:MAG: hypothetical protein LQ342_004588 [Letrouitia transgressa]